MAKRRSRKHHYLYMKAGGLLVAIHYKMFLPIGIILAALGGWLYVKDRPVFEIGLWSAFSITVAIVIGLIAYLIHLFRNRYYAPEPIKHQDHSNCAHTLEHGQYAEPIPIRREDRWTGERRSGHQSDTGSAS